MKCVRTILEDYLKKLGSCVARHPCMFTVCPIMFSLLLTTGIQRAKILLDVETLYAPSTSTSLRDRTYLEENFPTNLSSTFYSERYTRDGHFGAIIAVANDGGSILRSHILKSILLVDQEIQKINVHWDGRLWGYKDICAKRRSACHRDSFLSYRNTLLTKGNSENKTDFKSWLDGDFVKGAETYTAAKALMLLYYLDDSIESKKHLSNLWEDAFIKKYKSLRFPDISFEASCSRSLENISWATFRRSAFCVLIILCVIAICWLMIAFKPNAFQGKPWMGVVVAISSGLAVTSGHGLLMYYGVFLVPSSVIAAIVILGITTVDSLVMMSTWKWTDSKKSVEERLSETYSVIGVPITASFSINVISLLVGTAFSPFKEFSIFCFHASSCLALRLLYQITITGGAMAAFGYAEKRNLHSLTFRPVQVNLTKGSQISHCFCGDSYPEEINRNNSSVPSKTVMFAPIRRAISYTQTKSFVIVVYVIYLATSIWGICALENDYSLKEIVTGDDHVNSYFQKLCENFSQYHDRAQVVLNVTLNYADPEIQDKIHRMLGTFESDEYGNFRSKSWFRDYLKFLSDKKFSLVRGNYNLTDKKDFIHILRHRFLRYPGGSEYANDIIFDEELNDIVASRFFLRSYYPMDKRNYWNAIQKIRYASNQKFFRTIVFHSKLYIYEGTDVSLPTTLILLCTKALVLLFICSVIFCGIMQAVIVCIMFISVCMGVLGYLALWNVGMNPLSFKYIIGFSILSVNFLIHSACGCRISNKKSGNLEMVIAKGSTVGAIAMVATLIRPSWTLSSAFKTGFLTCLFATLHAICFQTTASSLYDSLNYRITTWSASGCSKNRNCRLAAKFRHPAVGGIYNGTVVISHIDIGR